MSDKWDEKAQEICVRWSGPAPFPPLKAAIALALRSATEEIPWLLKELDEQATILRAAVEAERAACEAIARDLRDRADKGGCGYCMGDDITDAIAARAEAVE